MAENDKTFELGICMAGAVSAGAYTAGVMDFLIESLDAWEAKRGEPGVPSHKVIIKAIGGASAGGMTGIITASALNNRIVPIQKADGNLLKPRPENKFYHAWVDLVQDDMFPLLLETDDIHKQEIYSLLNSNFLDKVAAKSLVVDKENWMVRPYVENKMKIFTTLTNLEGFEYKIKFKGNQQNNDYRISRHSDYGTFILNTTNDQYAGDGWIPLDFRTDVNTDIARDAALATGAFPVGLRARKITRAAKYVNDLLWNKNITEENPIKADPYLALIVDGGMINNEPFERFVDLIKGIHEDPNEFEGTVLMVDPFPSEAPKVKFDPTNDLITAAAGGTLSAMIGHLRTKPELLAEYRSDADSKQYQIAPTRRDGDLRYEGSKAIACGFLGGFGGFIHKEFRVHDYFLGRSNCEHFLREYFTVPKGHKNTIFTEGYKDISDKEFVSSNGGRQIIPLFTKKTEVPYMPTFESGTKWPVRPMRDVDRFQKAMERRVGKMIMNAADYTLFQRIAIGIGNRVILRKKAADAALDAIRKSMADHELLGK